MKLGGGEGGEGGWLPLPGILGLNPGGGLKKLSLSNLIIPLFKLFYKLYYEIKGESLILFDNYLDNLV